MGDHVGSPLHTNSFFDLSGLATLDTAFFCGHQVLPHALEKASKGEGFMAKEAA